RTRRGRGRGSACELALPVVAAERAVLARLRVVEDGAAVSRTALGAGVGLRADRVLRVRALDAGGARVRARRGIQPPRPRGAQSAQRARLGAAADGGGRPGRE